ncbi:hypothetical protein HSBGL_0949 [Halapricum desulfuricans]|uniref:Uncharacterized protein n=1 Tax=Halapricum desulfuricans TaxID=2841257 RepID=A0A897NFA5_9EURY|nr:hypothetical protein HSBGL_0949 [Halapricum desulfuricans]
MERTVTTFHAYGLDRKQTAFVWRGTTISPGALPACPRYADEVPAWLPDGIL